MKTRASSADSDKVASLVKQAKESDDFDAEEMRDLEVEMRHFTKRKEERDLLLGNEDDEWKPHEDKWTKKQKMGKSKKVDENGNLDDQLTDRKKSGKLTGFHHPRVLKLWKTAQQSNFTKEELVELKEELQHFEVKLMKHETVHEQASILKSEANSDGGNLLQEVEGKRDEMARGVKKMETYLEQKIMATKMEL